MVEVREGKMTDDPRQFVTFVSPNNYIVLTLDHFPAGAKPVRWNNQGLTGYVGVDKVANLLDTLRDNVKQHHYNTPPTTKIWWEETVSSLDKEVLKDSSDDSEIPSTDKPKK